MPPRSSCIPPCSARSIASRLKRWDVCCARVRSISPGSNVLISRVTAVTDELLEAFQTLIPQLTSNHPPPTRDDLAALLASEAATLLIARLRSEERRVGKECRSR